MSSDDSDSKHRRNGADEDAANNDRDSLASKLSKELNNWRRRRTTARPHRAERSSPGGHSEPARTIKVRGHETLVIRKPKIAPKAPDNPEPGDG